MEEQNKKIDNAWKENVEKEKLQNKEGLNSLDKGETLPAEPDFSFFVTSLSVQAAIALGQIPNPLTLMSDNYNSLLTTIIIPY